MTSRGRGSPSASTEDGGRSGLLLPLEGKEGRRGFCCSLEVVVEVVVFVPDVTACCEAPWPPPPPPLPGEALRSFLGMPEGRDEKKGGVNRVGGSSWVRSR